jgi:hypothetical protein
VPVTFAVGAAPVGAVVPVAAVVPAGQGPVVVLLDAADPVRPELPVAAGPVAVVPKGVVPLGAGFVADGEPTTAALLPVSPVAPIPAPVPAALPVLPVLPPLVWAMATVDVPNNSAVAIGRTLMALMQGSHIFGCDVGVTACRIKTFHPGPAP